LEHACMRGENAVGEHGGSSFVRMWLLGDHPESDFHDQTYLLQLRRYIVEWRHTFPEEKMGYAVAVRINHRTALIRVIEPRPWWSNDPVVVSYRVVVWGLTWGVWHVVRMYPSFPALDQYLPGIVCWRQSHLHPHAWDFVGIPREPDGPHTFLREMPSRGIIMERTVSELPTYAVYTSAPLSPYSVQGHEGTTKSTVLSARALPRSSRGRPLGITAASLDPWQWEQLGRGYRYLNFWSVQILQLHEFAWRDGHGRFCNSILLESTMRVQVEDCPPYSVYISNTYSMGEVFHMQADRELPEENLLASPSSPSHSPSQE